MEECKGQGRYGHGWWKTLLCLWISHAFRLQPHELIWSHAVCICLGFTRNLSLNGPFVLNHRPWTRIQQCKLSSEYVSQSRSEAEIFQSLCRWLSVRFNGSCVITNCVYNYEAIGRGIWSWIPAIMLTLHHSKPLHPIAPCMTLQLEKDYIFASGNNIAYDKSLACAWCGYILTVLEVGSSVTLAGASSPRVRDSMSSPCQRPDCFLRCSE